MSVYICILIPFLAYDFIDTIADYGGIPPPAGLCAQRHGVDYGICGYIPAHAAGRVYRFSPEAAALYEEFTAASVRDYNEQYDYDSDSKLWSSFS